MKQPARPAGIVSPTARFKKTQTNSQTSLVVSPPRTTTTSTYPTPAHPLQPIQESSSCSPLNQPVDWPTTIHVQLTVKLQFTNHEETSPNTHLVEVKGVFVPFLWSWKIFIRTRFDLSGRISVRNIPSVLAWIGWQAEEPHADAKIVVASMFWRIFLILQNKRCKYILAAVALLYARRERGARRVCGGAGAESCSLKGWETYQIFSVGR